jgi:phospholipid/cholesterol/gamma-HCH transport system permease protein
MTRAVQFLGWLGAISILLKDTTQELWRGKFYFRLLCDQIYEVGIRSIPLVFTVALSVGSVMALQFGVGLEKFGGKPYVPKIVSVSILRELGPVFASLMMAARIGAGFASEIGSLVVTQQIDAYRALGTSPIKIIVIPRVLACVIALPLLTVFANSLGVLGGLFIGHSDLGLDPQFYWQRAVHTLVLADFLSGFFKTFFFAIFIALPGVFYGLNVRGGTRGVGVATTQAVVTSSILIVLGDFVLTKAFLLVEQWK